jgi:hypothetical protein
MDSSVSAKEEIWFLRVCHHVSNALYQHKVTGSEAANHRYSRTIKKYRGTEQLKVQSTKVADILNNSPFGNHKRNNEDVFIDVGFLEVRATGSYSP